MPHQRRKRGRLSFIKLETLLSLTFDPTSKNVLMGLSVAGAKHGDAILIDEVVRREEATEAE